MAITHLELDGSWAQCLTPASCELLFHLPETTVAEASVIPLPLLLPLFEIINPPTSTRRTPSNVVLKEWRNEEGELHRDYDLPAQIYDNGALDWFQHGQRHRGRDLPASIEPDGMMEWYTGGLLHRENDQPAQVWPDGMRCWYQEGVNCRDGGLPPSITADGTGEWGDEKGEYHREDGPAVIFADGKMEWWTHGSFDRANFTEADDPVKWNRNGAA